MYAVSIGINTLLVNFDTFYFELQGTFLKLLTYINLHKGWAHWYPTAEGHVRMWGSNETTNSGGELVSG